MVRPHYALPKKCPLPQPEGLEGLRQNLGGV